VSYNNIIGLEIWSDFIDGVISLMKKKHQDAEKFLTSALTSL
jgi:hypothetical protein